MPFEAVQHRVENFEVGFQRSATSSETDGLKTLKVVVDEEDTKKQEDFHQGPVEFWATSPFMLRFCDTFFSVANPA